jgi:hypothetical protein
MEYIINKKDKTITAVFRYYRQTGIYTYKNTKELNTLKTKLTNVLNRDVFKNLNKRKIRSIYG